MRTTFPRALLFAAVSTALTLPVVHGQGLPDRPIRIVDGFSAGGAADYLARVLGPRLTTTLGRQIVVENRPGAGGTVGATIVAKSPPDGTIYLMASMTALTASPSLYSKLGYDVVRDFTPVGRVASGNNLVVTHPSLPVRSVKELVALARSRPGDLRYGSGGVGSGNHLAGELFKVVTGVNIQHIAYKGAPQAATAVMSGEIEFGFMSTAAGLGQVNAGRLRAIAVTGPTRDTTLPNVPTVRESGFPEYEAVLNFGLFAPAGTPREIVNLVNGEVGKALATSEVRERFAVQGFTPNPSTPEQLGAIARADVELWAKVIKAAGIKVD